MRILIYRYRGGNRGKGDREPARYRERVTFLVHVAIPSKSTIGTYVTP